MTDEQLQRLLVLDGSAGPALPIGAADARAIVEAALDGAGFGPGGGGDGGGAGGGGGGAGAAAISKLKLAILAGAALAVVAVVIALLTWRGTRGGSDRIAAVIADAALDARAAGMGTTATAVEPPAPPAPSAIAPATIEQTTIEPTTLEQAPEQMPAPPAPAKARAKPAADRELAEDLLAAANAKRAAKQWRASDALYAKVVARAPKSLAAQTALVASGSLRLEHLGDPKGAAQRFRRALALAPRGALAEDARWGLVEVARALHDTAVEKAALDDFLAHHADSPLATRAKARRAELP